MEPDKHPTGAKMVARTERVKDRVEKILKEWPSTRGDDRLLQWRYLRAYTGVRLSFSQFESLRIMPSPETITRRRREIQAENEELKPTTRVRIKRKVREAALHNQFGKGLKLTDFQEWRA